MQTQTIPPTSSNATYIHNLPEKQKPASGLCALVARIWEGMLLYLKKIFCLKKENARRVQEIFYNPIKTTDQAPSIPVLTPKSTVPEPKTSKKVINSYIVEEPGERAYKVTGSKEEPLFYSSPSFSSQSPPSVQKPSRTTTHSSQIIIPKKSGVYLVEEPDEQPYLIEDPQKKNSSPKQVPNQVPRQVPRQAPRNETASFDNQFFHLILSKKFEEARQLVENNIKLSDIAKKSWIKCVEDYKKGEEAIDAFKRGNIQLGLGLLKEMEKGSSKKSYIKKAVKILIKNPQGYAKEIVDLMREFTKGWQKDDLIKEVVEVLSKDAKKYANEIVDLLEEKFYFEYNINDAFKNFAKGLKISDSFSENSNRIKIAEELYKLKEYTAAAKLIKPVPKSEWGREDLAKKLAKHLI